MAREPPEKATSRSGKSYRLSINIAIKIFAFKHPFIPSICHRDGLVRTINDYP
jgi:hypothetical protein